MPETRSRSSGHRASESQASPLDSAQPDSGSCSNSHQSLFVLPPSIWWAEPATPHKNPSGNSSTRSSPEPITVHPTDPSPSSPISIYSWAGTLVREEFNVLLKGLNHVAVITNDASRLNTFYEEVFDAEIVRDGSELPEGKGPRLSIIKIGEWAELNVFQIEGNTEADRQTPMFGRGRLDHLAVQAASLGAFETIRDRLIARGAADDFVTDFGPMLSLFFRDPDGLECEVCVENPDAAPGVHHPPGTRAARFS